MVGSQWSGKVGCFLVFFMIPSGAGNLHSNPDFQIHTIQRWSHLKTWNQSLVILDIPNFNPMKEALWYSHPLLRYSIFRDGPRLYLQKKEWYVHIVRGPWFLLSAHLKHSFFCWTLYERRPTLSFWIAFPNRRPRMPQTTLLLNHLHPTFYPSKQLESLPRLRPRRSANRSPRIDRRPTDSNYGVLDKTCLLGSGRYLKHKP